MEKTLSRRALLGSAGVSVASITGLGVATAGDRVAAAPFARFQTHADPPLRIGVPAGWTALGSWHPGSVNPLPLAAVSNRSAPLPTLVDSAIPDVSLLDRRHALLTVSGVDLREETEYMPATISARDLQSHGLGWVDSGANEFRMAHAWVVEPGAQWGYLLYAWLGSEAESDRKAMNSTIASVEFR